MSTDSEQAPDIELDITSLSEDRLEKAEADLTKYLQHPVTKDNYEAFLEDIVGTIDEKRETLIELLDDRRELRQERAEVEQEFGEDELGDLREAGEGRWNFELYQLAELDRKLVRANEKLFEKAMVMKSLERVARVKLAEVVDEFDGQRLQARVYEKLEETMQKERDFMQEIVDQQADAFTTQMEDVRDEQKETRRMVQDSMTLLAQAVDRVGVQLEEVELQSETVADTELASESPGSSESPGESPDRGDGSLKQAIIDDLQKMQAGELKLTQKEIAERYDTDAGYVSRVKSQAQEEGIL
ncbi:hypothetical protein [Halomontanus rarus]|uniref:hypothetical protein n=1 Tax=Halomontanus rarus TaxID=3034020 RepID=UPI001A9931BA